MIRVVRRKAQATLELTLVVGVLFLMMIGVVRIMGWFNQDFISRQQAFVSSRVAAGSSSPGTRVVYATPEIIILGN